MVIYSYKVRLEWVDDFTRIFDGCYKIKINKSILELARSFNGDIDDEVVVKVSALISLGTINLIQVGPGDMLTSSHIFDDCFISFPDEESLIAFTMSI